MPPDVGIAIITHNAKHLLPKSLPPLLNSTVKPKVLVVNSSSQDGTVELAKEMGAETLIIPRPSFNHGTTREIARKALNSEIIVMTTPDAIATSLDTVEKLIEPIVSGKASASYARQIPHDGSDLFEAFPRSYNYPYESHLRSLKDLPIHGSYLFFFSDSFSAYKNSALEQIGGFKEVLTGEDVVAIAKMLHQGHSIAYAADAIVKHSHRYTLKQEFKRYFDTGLAREEYKQLIQTGGKDEKRGSAFTQALFQKVAQEQPHMLPYAVLQTLAKFIGYKIGQHSLHAPLWFKKALSSQDFYWTSDAFLQKQS